MTQIIIEEFDTVLLPKDELQRLNNGEDGKVFVDGKAFYINVIED